MDITDEMLQAAVGKAIEAGLLPRNAWRDDAAGNKELMRVIVQAALAAMPVQRTFHANCVAFLASSGTANFSAESDMNRTARQTYSGRLSQYSSKRDLAAA